MIHVRGAHLHNLAGVDVDVPRGQLVAVTGISGSGKSSLAFGTVHGEAQRRYFESVAPFARRLIGSATDPQVEAVEGLPPSVALQQNTSAGGARSTVGTVSTMSNTVRLLYSRVGDYPAGLTRLDSDHFSPNTAVGMCPDCQGTGVRYEPTEASMVPDPSLSINDGAIKAWPGAWAGKNFRDILDTLGMPMDTPWRDIDQATRDWILFTDETPVVTVTPDRRADQVEKQYQGTWRSTANYLRKTLAETESDTLRKRTISFMEESVCPTCDGRRLGRDALSVTYAGLPIDELGQVPLERLADMLADVAHASSEAERLLLGALRPILDSALELGLGHLSLDRPARTLSAGELQRVRLASQLKTGLFGVMYVLDEPSAGLHPVERQAVLDIARRFIAQGNTVMLVEHDMDLVAASDWIVDVGPGAGAGGGRIVYSGPTAEYLAAVRGEPRQAEQPQGADSAGHVPGTGADGTAAGSSDAPGTDSAGPAGEAERAGNAVQSPTAAALAAGAPRLNDAPRAASGMLELHGASSRTVRDLDLEVGFGQFTVIAGVSGSGKTTLLDMLTDAAEEQAGRVLPISQKPIGRTPRSCLATYTGFFDTVRRLFAGTEGARKRGWTVSRFSYNVKQGQCPTCRGEGEIEVELVFLPGSYTTCPDCGGRRYNDETLEVTWNGYTIADVLAMTVDEAAEVFEDQPVITTLQSMGLGYLRLGQGAPTLSGGEAQRIKLATELTKARRGRTVYLLDEPTTGLHPADVDRLLAVLEGLADAGGTVIVVEHDPRVIAAADRVLETGPGAGERGGRVIADATPARLAAGDTATGRALAAAGRERRAG
ncbi:excinuclease ABC subunit A [Corynebacterium frankenforstense DSM 45800]|uniref:UvrABC system protein A n=1 Tax=Corynebacterium frankenforstense DSM 45800 TaxID=1437875 RepID=A0A1L7CQW6_9CORY|nr:excinuclease ABC subunit UvrA [Corynebacterium frankenforstense]APT88209.1 excinuclease ABC subunit A [Corynebacterium frankenforstense DSM 45800]